MSDELLKQLIDNQKNIKTDFDKFSDDVKLNLRDTNTKLDSLSDKIDDKIEDHKTKIDEEITDVSKRVGKLQLAMAKFAGVRLALGYIVPGLLVVVWFAAQKIINSFWE